MKKFLTILSIIILSTVIVPFVQAKEIPFSQGYSMCDSKPLITLVTAKWSSSNQEVINEFKLLQQYFGTRFNYSIVDITLPQAQDYNKHFRIEQNLPYVMFYRNGGKVSRYLNRECASNAKSCLIPKIKSLIQ